MEQLVYLLLINMFVVFLRKSDCIGLLICCVVDLWSIDS